jgi:hypothetical protein
MKMNSKKVLGFENYVIYENGSILGPKGNFLAPWMGRGGYLKICLKQKPKVRWVYLHRLMCENFIDNPLNKKEINHKDGDKLNNCLSNLEWVTKSENGLHAFLNGLNHAAVGEKSANHKLTDKDIVQIRSMRGIITQKEIGKIFGINDRHICQIQLNRYWKHVAQNQEVAHV